MLLKKTDLHVHIVQSLYPEDLFLLAKDHFYEINWNRFGFLDKYKQIFGIALDPISIFERAVKTGSIKEIENICCYPYNGNGNFDEFNIKSYFCICVQGFYGDKGIYEPVLQLVIDRHKKEGLRYVEYRNGFGGSGEEWKLWHANYARFLKKASDESFTAKYIVRLGNYNDFKEMLTENPDLCDVVVGVDFSGKEIPPENLKSFYQEINRDRQLTLNKTPDVVVHIGENFFDKSLESAIRWCHQSALFGAKRLAHCIVLGLEPTVAISRQQNAHAYESVGERIAQISYDLEHINQLAQYGVTLNFTALNNELNSLKGMPVDEQIYKPYDEKRLNDVSKRQDYVLDELKRLGVSIEVCPTSNLCIGGVPTIQEHPFIKLYNSGVDMAICTDDPGIFKSSLSDEIDFVINSFGIDTENLSKRMGDPFRLRLKKNNSHNKANEHN